MFRGWLSGDRPEASQQSSVRLVVGLGNPGAKYADTRHNVGFRVVEEIARRTAAGPSRKKFHGELYETRIDQHRLLMLLPTTFMNRSGTSVLAARDFFKSAADEILIVCDDFQLPLGKLRVRPRGSSGGQKGLADVIRRLGTQDIPRLRLGIGQPPQQWDVADYVLSRFKKDEKQVVEEAVLRSADAVETWIRLGIEPCMNEFNRDVAS